MLVVIFPKVTEWVAFLREAIRHGSSVDGNPNLQARVITKEGQKYMTHVVEGRDGDFEYQSIIGNQYPTDSTFVLFGTSGSHVFPVGSAHHVTTAYKVQLRAVIFPAGREIPLIVDDLEEPRKFTTTSINGEFDHTKETNEDNEPRALCTNDRHLYFMRLPFETGFSGVDRCVNLFDKETFSFFAISRKVLNVECKGAIRVVCGKDPNKCKRKLTDISEGYRLFEQLYLSETSSSAQ